LKFYRNAGTQHFPLTTRIFKGIGIFPVRHHYYDPLVTEKDLNKPLSDIRNLPGLDFKLEQQKELFKRLVFEHELADLASRATEAGQPPRFKFGNGTFESGDAEFLYQFIRLNKPNKVVEIGSGNSTLIAVEALQKNESETGKPAQHICIEPYEMPWLGSIKGLRILRNRVQDLEFDWAEELGPGDLLFIDSSHMIRPQGDVLKEYLEILPRLKSGVFVHVHDIFTPRDYLEHWVLKSVCFWNEQYLLEAVLGNSHRYEIVAMLNLLKHDHFDMLKRVCPFLTQDREPGSLYFKVK
jgi:hypothetical protein